MGSANAGQVRFGSGQKIYFLKRVFPYDLYYGKLSEKIAVKFSDELITDNKAIQSYVAKEYARQSNLIAYGADHAIKMPLTDEIRKIYPKINDKYAINVCRIEPENNIHIILEGK